MGAVNEVCRLATVVATLWAERTRPCRRLAVGVALDASDVGGQDVDAVAVQMPRARS